MHLSTLKMGYTTRTVLYTIYTRFDAPFFEGLSRRGICSLIDRDGCKRKFAVYSSCREWSLQFHTIRTEVRRTRLR